MVGASLASKPKLNSGLRAPHQRGERLVALLDVVSQVAIRREPPSFSGASVQIGHEVSLRIHAVSSVYTGYQRQTS